MRLARLLQQNGYHVILTRNEDKGLYTGNQGSKKVEDLKNRIALIESSGAALAVSIHQNSYSAEGVCGAQVFTMRLPRPERKRRRSCSRN